MSAMKLNVTYSSFMIGRSRRDALPARSGLTLRLRDCTSGVTTPVLSPTSNHVPMHGIMTTWLLSGRDDSCTGQPADSYRVCEDMTSVVCLCRTPSLKAGANGCCAWCCLCLKLKDLCPLRAPNSK